MAPEEGGDSNGLSREECQCPICLEIFMEPVTLPCSHTFCKVCFLESVDKATLCCPLCRKRVSTWVRQQTRNKSLVNEALWRKIQSTFPKICERRLLGQDTGDTAPLYLPRLSEPGALRQEYEDQVSKLTEEKRELEEQERRASEEFIQRLLAEEEQLQKELRRRHEDDEKLAKLLSRELNTAPESGQSLVPAATPMTQKPVGQINRFLCPLSRSPARSTQANKENVSLPPELDLYSPQTDQSHPEESRHEDTAQSEREAEPSGGGTKRKGSEVRPKDETRGKRTCVEGGAMADWEAERQRRRRQEEEDLRLALELQRQLDQQERQPNRSKGSEDAYPLRAARRTRTDPLASGQTPPTVTQRNIQVRRNTHPTATVTLSTLSAPQTTADSSASPPPPPATAGLATPNTFQKSPQTPKPNRQTTQTPKPNRQTTQTPKPNRQTTQTPKPNRQTTLLELFNLHT